MREALLKLQNAFQTLIVQHEEFTKLIGDDEEFEAQEACLEESQGLFINLETDTKLYLDSAEELQSNVRVNDKETLSSDTENFSKSDTPSELSVESNTMSGTVVDNIIKETNALDINASIDRKRNSESAGKEVTKETSKMSKFCGDVRDYAIFRAYFKHAIEVRF